MTTLLQRLKAIGIDFYMLLLFATVALAVLVPASGTGAVIVSHAAYYGVALLFFLYGARLDPAAVWDGLRNWRLQGGVFAMTYLAFPLIGLALSFAMAPWLDSRLVTGLLFLCVLPSTIQSSIALTALARGNVPAAVCAASLSNLAGVVLAPLLAALLLQAGAGNGISSDAVVSVAVQILLPFGAGQLLRPWIGAWIRNQRLLTLTVDRGSILLIVYSAFSAGIVAGVWQVVDLSMLALLILAIVLLLVAISATALAGARALSLAREDRIVLLLCGATKSLASGLPIARILFDTADASLIILPLMLFHQLQLFVFAVVAQRYGRAR